MKKILTAALAVIVTALALTGCDNSNSESNNNSSDTTSSAAVSNTETSSDEGTSSDETSSDPEGEYIPSLTERIEFPDTKSGKMAKAAIEFNPDEWSMGMTLADDETLTTLLPDLTPDMFEEYCFIFDMMPINGHTIFAGKPKAGQEDAVKTALENSLESYKQQVSFYPAGQNSAENAQIGTTNDGYCYFVVHAEGAAIADAMTK